MGAIKLDDSNKNFTGGGGAAVLPSGTIARLLESAEVIDKYMAENGYTYTRAGNYNNTYNEGSSKNVCCATYVSWCLQDAGFLSQHVDHSRYIYESLDADSNWTKIEPSDMSDLQPGDVGVYSDTEPFRHSNIYAGDSKFWDAGNDGAVKEIGSRVNILPTYAFRYTGP